jgi:cytochrome c-type biogenesis protein CcmH
MRALLVVVPAVLLIAGPTAASERHPTLAELESEIICPTCKTTLDQSDSPIAQRIERFIVARIAAGDTKGEIKSKLVAQFGESVLASPPKHGFGLLAWVLPLVGLAVGAVVIGLVAWRWTHSREPAPVVVGSALAPELDRRVDEELRRFDG